MPFVASGTYGCIFKPSLKCRDKSRSSAKSASPSEVVGKIFADAKEAEIEQRIQESIVHQVDPEGVFTVKFINACEVTEEQFRPEDETDECPHIIDRDLGAISPTKYKQIVYSYGGISLESYLKKEKPSWNKFKKLLFALGPIFEGVDKLNKMGWVHQDIKPGNILIHDHGAFLIDFGLLTSVGKIYSESNNFVLNYPYPFYPPEFKLKAAAGSPARFKTLVGENFEAMERAKRRLIELGVDFEDDIKSGFESGHKDPLKIDSYSLGVVLALIYDWAHEYVEAKKKFAKTFAIVVRALCCQDATKRANSAEGAAIYKEMIGA